ncbi:DUF234 domain-containing protein [Shewanella glacialipiscicola]|uniref:DUF234 domain-containing protein n=1 Tax=Shewanella glacialipiscicola TaxID=614069 RepID=UPI0021D8CEE8|nr:DUF234 domain-containing protein [Shewanella glacialipiscicola]MCU7995591.1 DUF234 domain-containing protein [Shewanella glacialipiscicola]MCU8026838.1 DUF234 domain-containing protein [Shewanella glacialipiscicola]
MLGAFLVSVFDHNNFHSRRLKNFSQPIDFALFLSTTSSRNWRSLTAINAVITMIFSRLFRVCMRNDSEYIRRLIERDFEVFSGLELESLFSAILVESKQYGRIGGYWDAKGHNEIDIVAINDLDKKILIAEVKRKQKRYSEAKLIEKSVNLLQKLNVNNYSVEYRGFSLDNLIEVMDEYQAN